MHVPKHITGDMLVSDWNEKINGNVKSNSKEYTHIALNTGFFLVFAFQLDIYLPNLIVITMGSTILQYQKTD